MKFKCETFQKENVLYDFRKTFMIVFLSIAGYVFSCRLNLIFIFNVLSTYLKNKNKLTDDIPWT